MTPEECIAKLTHTENREAAKTCFIRGEFVRVKEQTIVFSITRGKAASEVELLRSAVSYTFTSSTSALIELPRFYAEARDLAGLILTDEEARRQQAQAASFNALRPSSHTKAEKVGGIRIN